MDAPEQRKRITFAGILLGLGLGGFFDGIVLHQILQWHHMLSSTSRWNVNTVHGLQMNTLGDGLFHAAAWVLTLAGLAILSTVLGEREQVVPWSRQALVGLLLMGWGLFNLVEGIVDHELLGIHHVRSGVNHVWYDMGFLLWGVLMVAGGWALKRQGWQPEQTTVHAAEPGSTRSSRRDRA